MNDLTTRAVNAGASLVPGRYSRPSRQVPVEQRAAIGRMIEDARAARGWSREQLARAAMRHLAALEQQLKRYGIAADVAITRHHVAAMEEGLPMVPLRGAQRRARLLGVVLALGLDRREVNLLAGGI